MNPPASPPIITFLNVSKISVTLVFIVTLAWKPAVAEYQGTIIDAHSQIDQFFPLDKVVSILDLAGVSTVLLSARGKVKPQQIVALARKHPKRIIASVRTKGYAWAKNGVKFYKLLKKQMSMPEFKAMSELILWHAAKGKKAPQWIIASDSPQAKTAMKAAFDRKWPVVLHYELRAAGFEKKRLLEDLRKVLADNPEQNFLLIHMAQIDLKDAADLLQSFTNIHFMTSHSNPVTLAKSSQPWTNLFKGQDISPEWRTLMEIYPARFVLNFDNVFSEHWGNYYIKQVKLWRQALGVFPPEVASAIAYRNAARLWNLEYP